MSTPKNEDKHEQIVNNAVHEGSTAKTIRIWKLNLSVTRILLRLQRIEERPNAVEFLCLVKRAA